MKILVTGATGSVGREVVAQLRARGHAVRAVARDPGAARLPGGTEVVPGDLADPASIAAQVGDTEAVFLLWPFVSAGLTARLAPEVTKVLAAGPGRIVHLSAPQAQEDPGSSWGLAEDSVRRSGTGWTLLRPSGFAKNTLIWAPQITAGDVVRWPYGQARRSLIHEADIAAVAVAALTEDGHDQAVYSLTGPAVVSQAEQVEIIGAALNRPLRWQEMPAAEAREQLTATFGDAGFAEHALATWAGFVDQPEAVTSTVREVTGRPARPFSAWVADHADAFR
jgi:uncharacterized protein YbjT (DUF2867 family)